MSPNPLLQKLNLSVLSTIFSNNNANLDEIISPVSPSKLSMQEKTNGQICMEYGTITRNKFWKWTKKYSSFTMIEKSGVYLLHFSKKNYQDQ